MMIVAVVVLALLSCEQTGNTYIVKYSSFGISTCGGTAPIHNLCNQSVNHITSLLYSYFVVRKSSYQAHPRCGEEEDGKPRIPGVK